jgi:hypothetical protein
LEQKIKYQNFEDVIQLDRDSLRILFENRALLEQLAKKDGDEFVREIACHYLLQTAVYDGQLQELLIERLLWDESGIVRSYILREDIRRFPLLNRPTLEVLLSDNEDEIRAATFGLISQFDYGWTLQPLFVESGLNLVYEAFFSWVLWITGYERYETDERIAEGLGMAWMFYEELPAISKQDPKVDIFARADGFRRTVVPDSREADMDKRKEALVSMLRELEKEPGLGFLIEIFVGWASGFPNSKEIIFELGKRMYYATKAGVLTKGSASENHMILIHIANFKPAANQISSLSSKVL